MYQLMRNIHLWLGLAFVIMALVFAVSSLTIIYRPWLPDGVDIAERTVQLQAASNATPREIALELMRDHDLIGELRPPSESDGVVKLQIVRPGDAAEVEYNRETGEAAIKTRHWNFLETLVQLHVNHGFWHDFMPSQLWAILSFTSSAGLLLLGASGIYLWFKNNNERLIGGIILLVSSVYGLTTLILTRMAG